MAKPVLSIGIIFKNEIRCLERCVKAFQPLRDAVPCELIMADTGSDDGSREIAEKYADIFFDFPWVNDFAAARNALMERASGEWFLTVDADEWLEKDVSELINFFNTPSLRKKFNGCALIIRNYTNSNLEGDYSDFLAIRMIKRSTGICYEGAIHEHWNKEVVGIYGCGKTVLNHDGYVNFSGEKGKAKRERNMALLREKIKESPNDPLLLLQCTESGTTGGEQEQYARRAIASVLEKRPGWNLAGPPIYRYAINLAKVRGLTELEEWLQQAQELFPNSLFTRVDIAYTMCIYHLEKKEYAPAIPYGETYLEALAKYRTEYDHITDLAYSSLMYVSPSSEEKLKVLLADAYFYEKQYEKAKDTLASLDGSQMAAGNVRNYTGIMMNLHAQSGLDMRELMGSFWEQICQETPTEQRAKERKSALYAAAAQSFPKEYRKAEDEKGFGYAYTLFLPLEGKCGVGDAAAILEATDIRRMEEVLARQEDYSRLPIHALSYALEQGVTFPLSNSKPFPIEEMDSLASRLSGNFESFLPYVLKKAETPPKDWQGLLWVRGLLMGALRKYPWSSEVQDTEQGMALARAFAKVEEEFLPRCYCKEILREDALFVLPPLHRFGWYCAKAFAAMESQDTVGYVRLLREGLESCPDVKDMVEFLADHTSDFQKLLGATPELLALAEQMRALLQQFDPNDPAILVLKSSPQYQQVAYLIERDTIQSPLLRQIPQ